MVINLYRELIKNSRHSFKKEDINLKRISLIVCDFEMFSED